MIKYRGNRTDPQDHSWEKITVIRVNGQEEVRNAEVGGRNITLDVYALDEMDRKWTLRCREIPKAPISAGQDTTAVCWIPKC